MGNSGNSFISFASAIAGAELTTYTGTSTGHQNFGGSITAHFFRTSADGIIGRKYNQIGIAIFGNATWNLAVYDDLLGVPDTLLSSTGSIAITANGDNLVYSSITEFTLTTSAVWLCAFSSSAANNPYDKVVTYYRKNKGSLTYPTLPDPSGAGADVDQDAVKMGIKFV